MLAAVLHARGRERDARAEAAKVLGHNPKFRLATLQGRLSIVRDQGIVARLAAVMRSLGLE